MKEPKEKAKDLVDKYVKLVPSHFGGMDIELAKQCAIINCEELINEHTFKNPIGWNIKRLKYWQEVKQELLNLN
jgi:hypothetical protein